MAGSRSSCSTTRARSRKPSTIAGERAEEARQLADQVHAGEAREHRQHQAAAAAHEARGEVAGGEEHPQRAALQEARHAHRRVEEVQRVARRRGVEHDRVEAPLAVQLVQLGDRAELLGARHRARRSPGRCGWRAPRSRARSSGASGAISASKVPFASSIVAHSSPVQLDPLRGQQRGLDPPRLVVELVDAERARQPPRGVDRHDRHPLPFARQPQRERRRGGRLAHAARAGADADALAAQPLREASRSSWTRGHRAVSRAVPTG